MSSEEKARILRAIWREKMHVEPRALELSPSHVSHSYEHVWQPAELLLVDLETLPAGLLRFWQECSRGHVVFTHQSSGYQPGPQPWRDGTLESVCYLSLTDLHEDKRTAMLALSNLLDHLLGSKAREGDPWLSDGSGANAALREVGVRFAQVFALGYGQAELGARTAHDYLARTFWMYLHEPDRLNALDPLVFKLYRNTLLREEFWQARSPA
jgi:hypothetical protein